jgi:hypothetical protein
MYTKSTAYYDAIYDTFKDYSKESNMANHLKPGGVLIVEPWITPQAFTRRHVGAVFVNQPKLKIARINIAKVRGRISSMTFHYVVGTPDGVRYITETHDLGLFTPDESLRAFRECGLKVRYYSKGLMGRGLYVAVKPLKRNEVTS